MFISVCTLHSNVHHAGTSLSVQWLRLQASTAGGTGLIPGQGTKILQAVRPKKKKFSLEIETVFNGHLEDKYIVPRSHNALKKIKDF